VLKGIHLTLLVGPGVPIPAPKPLMDALESVEVTSSADTPSGFQLSFVVDNRSPLHTLLLVAGGQVPWLRVILVATMNSLPTVLMDGLITRQEITGANEPGQSRLTITGEDLTVAMDKQDMSGLPYPAMPPAARVALIVARYGLYGMLPIIIPSLFEDIPIPVERIPTHEGTDLAYIRQLAKEAGHVFYIEPGPLPGANVAYWGPEIRLGMVQPALNLGMDVHSNVEALSFRGQPVRGRTAHRLHPEPDHQVSDSAAHPRCQPGQPAARPDSAHAQEHQADEGNRQAVADRRPRQGAGRGRRLFGRCGDRRRQPRRVALRPCPESPAAGRRARRRLSFDGLYYVKKVSSKLKAGEFKQSFSLARNGLISTLPLVPA
jgi:hypothetical protein